MRDGLNHRRAGKHADPRADSGADSHADPDADADARIVVYPITIQRARAIADGATQADTNPDSEPNP